MKKKNIKYIPIICLALIFSCKKDLDQAPIGSVDEAKLTNKKGVEGLLIGAYSLLDGYSNPYVGNTNWGSAASNWVYGSVCGTEAYKGSSNRNEDQNDIRILERFEASPLNGYLAQKWALVYAGVQRANEVLRIMKKAIDISETDQQRISGEARFLRGFYHFEAIKMWNKVPYVDETVTYDAGNYHLPNDTLIWGAIENDFRYAMENLPVKMVAIGRCNKHAAEAYLAKAYIFQGKFDPGKFLKAELLLNDLITNGNTAGGIPYALLPNYSDNFNIDSKNSSESVFAAQMSVSDGGQGTNGNYGDILNYPFQGNPDAAPGVCCGFFQPSQWLVNHYKTNSITGLPDPDHFNEVPVKSDDGLSSSDPFVPYDGPLDPRLDWTVGRRGIPYLDWGDHPGNDWIRAQVSFGPYSPIKNTYYKTQKEHYTDASFWSTGAVANNVNLIRFADILLWAAEAEIETGNLEKGREYINKVRARAMNPDGFVRRSDGQPAAKYYIRTYTETWTDKESALKALRYERMLELGMEGHRFFDLVRWGIADKEINDFMEKEKSIRIFLTGAHFTKGINEYFPIPQRQIDLSAGADGVPKTEPNHKNPFTSFIMTLALSLPNPSSMVR